MSTTEFLLVAVRAIHFASALALFGAIAFALLASRRPRMCRTVIAAWLIAVISGACWLLLEATLMGGQPLDGGWDIALLRTVVERTVFGQAWSVRAVLALVLAGLWLWVCVRRGAHLPWLTALAALLAGAFVVGLAWAGHANIEGGWDGAIHHLGDGLHLLAAGAWLGGLAPLAGSLHRLCHAPSRHDLDAGARVVTRFGTLSATCVGVLLATGVVNARYTLHSPAALLDTPYGQLLLVKLGLFALMLAIAAVNRARLTPALRDRDDDVAARLTAARRLQRNAWLEQALGLAILVLVGALGITAPPLAR